MITMPPPLGLKTHWHVTLSLEARASGLHPHATTNRHICLNKRYGQMTMKQIQLNKCHDWGAFISRSIFCDQPKIHPLRKWRRRCV